MSATSPATASDPGAPRTPGDKTARRLTGLRRNSVAISVIPLCQYGLGTAINLYIHGPATGRGGGAAAGTAMPHLPPYTACSGVFLLVAGVSVLTRAVIIRHRQVIVTPAADLPATSPPLSAA
jgi:hypothetical protein